MNSSSNMQLDKFFETYTHLSNEFYRNYDNLWNFTKLVGGVLTALAVTAIKFHDLQIMVHLISIIVSISGLFLIVHVKRIMVAIDQILCRMYCEYLLVLFRDDPDRVELFKYPKPSEFLKGINYVFSIHNCFSSILCGFLVLSIVRLSIILDILSSAKTWIFVIICLGLWIGLMFVIWIITKVEFNNNA